MSSSATSMDIGETFRPEDISKTDFFDFVTPPDMGGVGDRPPGGNDTNTQSDQPLQGFDQVNIINLKYFISSFRI